MKHAILLALTTLAPAQDAVRGYVETRFERASYYTGERVIAFVDFGIATDDLDRLIQPFRQQLDVAAQVDAPWTRSLPNGTALAPALDAGRFVAINGERAQVSSLGRVTRDGTEFDAYRYAVAFVPNETAELRFDAPNLRLVYATEFREDFISGRVPVDRHDSVIGSSSDEPTVIRIEPLPPGPDEFTGAIGRFSTSASSTATILRPGETCQVELTVSGDGNFGHFAAPPLGDPAVARVLGVLTESDESGGVTFRYDVVAVAGGRLESLRFVAFDPATARFVAAESSLGVTIDGPPPKSDDVDVTAPEGPRLIEELGSHSGRTSRTLVLLLLLAPIALRLGIDGSRAVRLRRRRSREAALPWRRLTTALDTAGQSSSSITGTILSYLAQRYGQTQDRLLPSAAATLAASGVPQPLADDVQHLIASCEAARFGSGTPPERQQIESVMRRVEDCWRRRQPELSQRTREQEALT